jgi:hypothetical protein
MNHCKQIPIDEAEERISDCEYCAEYFRLAKETGLTHLWINIDDHVATDPKYLEDREATNRKYGLT